MISTGARLPWVRRHMALFAICAIMLSFFIPLPGAQAASNQAGNAPLLLHFSLRKQPLRAALLAFSQQAGIQLIYVEEVETEKEINPLDGQYTVEDALSLLLRNSGFEYEFSKENTVTVRRVTPREATPPAQETLPLNSAPASSSENAEAFIDEVISVGTRGRGRTALQTPVPVDTIGGRDMMTTGETETGRILQFLNPSFNFSTSSISDGTDAVKPATLRGLNPDQTLVLVNGKRRHSSALVHVNTSVGRGATGVDMNAIPPSSIKQIEILRDGAAAQYGSDAIAGVINIVLKDQQEGGSLTSSWGQTYKGDGDIFVVSANYGFAPLPWARLTLSAEYRDKQHSNRAGLSGCLQYDPGDQESCGFGNLAVDPREESFDRRNFRIGESDSEQKTLLLNLSLPYHDNSELYLFGTYSDRNNQSTGFFRRANEYSRTVIEIFPDGYLPLLNAGIRDFSVTAGGRWDLGDDFYLDSSLTTGGNRFQFLIDNSLNASFGVNSPTSANAGALKLHQSTVNLDVSKYLDTTHFAFGLEWHREHYQIVPGEPVSYADGGTLNYTCPGCDINPVPYAAGFQLFKGLSPANSADESRTNIAIYADMEIDVSPSLLLNLATRFEDYSDFGNKLIAKLATRYQISPGLAARGSVSTGFRAPSMQQKFFNSTNTQFIEVNGRSVSQERGTFRTDSAVARALGIPALKPETSTNLSLGFIATPLKNLTITADYYLITIRDRIAITGSIPIEENFPGVTEATGATDGQFFTNMADTKTEGVDLVVHYDIPLAPGQKLRLSLAANKTCTRIKEGSIASPLEGVDNLQLFSLQDRAIIEDWQPSSRINIAFDYTNGPWSLVLRNNMHGAYTVCEGSCTILSGPDQNIQQFPSKWLTDIQLSYSFEKLSSKVTLGVNNLFNVYPDINLIGQARAGSIEGIVNSPGIFTYPRRSAPFGINGGSYYIRLVRNF